MSGVQFPLGPPFWNEVFNMKIQEIDSAVENNRCPEPAFCTVATTVYDSHTRERKCLKCWLEFCKTHNIEIDYD